MDYPHQDLLSDIVAVRPPSRKNQFTLLATASAPNQSTPTRLLLQQTKQDHRRSLRDDLETWHNIIASDDLTAHDTHLVPVKGTFTLPIPTKLCPPLLPKSVSSDRPVVVLQYYERGSLRSCLDQGDFLQSRNPSLPKTSDWSAKLQILKDIAAALHFIQRHMHGQQHGAVSSDAVFIDRAGRAFLAWHHQLDRTRPEMLSLGNVQETRYFSPEALDKVLADVQKQTQHLSSSSSRAPAPALPNHGSPDYVVYDDMYAFGVLAWELATEEFPFETVEPPTIASFAQQSQHRFQTLAPPRLNRLIQKCLQVDQASRPSWCTVVDELNALNPEEVDTPLEEKKDEHTPKSSTLSITASTIDPNQPTTTLLVTKQGEVPSDQAEKSKVVDMMESVLNSTFYRRELPPHLDAFTSEPGKRLFREMIQAGTGECFFKLCTSFNTQSDPAFCGVSSLSMVLNALEIDPRRQWRGVWRWYSDEQLDCCASIDVMRQKGITFNQFACLARCHAKVVVKRADRHTLQEFRKDIQRVASSDDCQMVLSFSRAALGQTGSGHFSPVGGYHAGQDKVLVLDTARFKYPPFFATVTELWESLQPKDPETGICRGYFMITLTAKQRLELERKRLVAETESSATVVTKTRSTDSGSGSEKSLGIHSSASSSMFSLSSIEGDIDDNSVRGDRQEVASGHLSDEGDKAECDCDCEKPRSHQ
ncbi:hypothetical protein BGW38_003639 [Lunasporangiospora selenospora]|uniref:glutathione gamma-glutamylcysteinyltransferase n=1 Tax=Lunasporangiospora selenospora TaxID=979761 RepID=A0A9P6KCK0_9FUNG|nr:hypothetical protein BGW38_003639 [Lunasporangiospora selenospora]